MVGTSNSDRGPRLAAPYAKGPEIKEAVKDYWVHKVTFIDGVGQLVGTKVPMTPRQAKYLERAKIVRDFPPDEEPKVEDLTKTIYPPDMVFAEGEAPMDLEEEPNPAPAAKKPRRKKK